jgi:hypothetical protein
MSQTPQPAATPRFVLTTQGELYGQDTTENREIVRRIHACVAACEGISTEDLERGVVAEMRQVIADVLPILQARQGRSAVQQPTGA